MNEKFFGEQEFRDLLRRLMGADGQELQNLECEIIDLYKDTMMTAWQYRALYDTCQILLEFWRINEK